MTTLKVSFIVLFGSIAGLILVGVVILINFLRRKPRYELLAAETITMLLIGVLRKDYMSLLAEAQIQPTGFDKLLYNLYKVFMLSCIGSAVLVVIEFIRN